jgi:hypothetical protein
MADPTTYMRMANEAVSTRDPLRLNPYPRTKIDNTIRRTNPYVYPAVDWMDMLIKDHTSNQRANLNISGGGTVARYYVAGAFSQDNGILKVDNRNSFNNNINYKNTCFIRISTLTCRRRRRWWSACTVRSTTIKAR